MVWIGKPGVLPARALEYLLQPRAGARPGSVEVGEDSVVLDIAAKGDAFSTRRSSAGRQEDSVWFGGRVEVVAVDIGRLMHRDVCRGGLGFLLGSGILRAGWCAEDGVF